jgi:hypothetical protein
MKRFLLFAGVFTGVVALVYLLVFGANAKVFSTVWNNRQALAEGSDWVENTYSLAGLADFMAKNPKHASVVLYDATADTLLKDFEGDVRRPLGALGNLILLVALDDAITAGRLSLNAPVDPDQIRSYRVEGIEARRMEETLSQLGDTPTLEQAVDLMIRTGHWWISDYLYESLGAETVAQYTDSLGKGGIDAYVPFHQLFASNAGGMDFQTERRLYDTFPKGTANAVLDVLKNASPRVIDWLSWPMENASIQRDMTQFSALFESRMSILSGVSIGTSRYTGSRYVQVVMLTDIPAGLWFHLSANFMNQDFQQRLVYDPAMQDKVLSL